MNYRIKSISYKGNCEKNEDASFYIHSDKFIKAAVCDGVGSYVNALQAAKYASEYICQTHSEHSLSALINECHLQITNNPHLGFTTIAAVKHKHNSSCFECINCGDTRIYVIGKGYLTQLSIDHTNQKRLEKVYSKYYEDYIDLARQFSVLEAALGHILEIHSVEYTLSETELLILATDGAWEPLEKSFIQASQFHTPQTREEFLELQLNLLNQSNSLNDNATLLMIWKE